MYYLKTTLWLLPDDVYYNDPFVKAAEIACQAHATDAVVEEFLMKLQASDEHNKEGGGKRKDQKRIESRSTLLYTIVVHRMQLRDSRSSKFKYGYGRNLRYLQSPTCWNLAHLSRSCQRIRASLDAWLVSNTTADAGAEGLWSSLEVVLGRPMPPKLRTSESITSVVGGVFYVVPCSCKLLECSSSMVVFVECLSALVLVGFFSCGVLADSLKGSTS